MNNSKQRFGRYEIFEEIGRGGFAAVFRAVDVSLERQAALKILHSLLMQDVHLRARFLQEARSTASLNHPNIVTIYEIGEIEGKIFIAMELLPNNLGSYLVDHGTLSLLDTIVILRQIAKALDYAHSNGVIHRDIKPSNIALDPTPPDFHAKLLDFGLAKPFMTDRSLSDSGNIIGTASYIAPEIWENAKIGPEVDIYALGIVAYEMLTGQAAFPGSTPPATMRAHFGMRPDPRALRKDLPSHITEVFRKVLAISPSERYQTALAFVDALENLSENAISVTTPTPKPSLIPRRLGVFPRTLLLKLLSTISLYKTDNSVKPSTLSSVKTQPLSEIPPAVAKKTNPSMILRPHVQRLLDPFKYDVIRELLDQQDAERLISFMAHYPEARYLLTGYGRFGGTTLTKEIVKEVGQRVASGETLVVLRFDRIPSLENSPVFDVLLQVSSEEVKLGRCALDLEPVAQENVFTIREILDTLNNYLSGRQEKSVLYRTLQSKLKSMASELRIMIVVDDVVTPEPLTAFLSHVLFVENHTALLAVVEREVYNRWDDDTKRFFRNKKSVREWYVPCLWESQYSFVEQILELLFSGYSVNTPEATEMRRLFSQHIVFIGRGVAGRALQELRDYHKYWQLDAMTGQPFITFETLDRRWLSNNAWLQDLLDHNWDKILGRNFPKREIEDRAKQGVYALLDWIVEHATFSRDDILEAAETMPVIISSYQRLRQGTVTRLLDVLVENEYLTVVENEYDIIWGIDLTEKDLKFRSPPLSSEGIQRSLERRINKLLEDYEAITGALEDAIGPVERERMKRQADDLEEEIQELKRKLANLVDTKPWIPELKSEH